MELSITVVCVESHFLQRYESWITPCGIKWLSKPASRFKARVWTWQFCTCGERQELSVPTLERALSVLALRVQPPTFFINTQEFMGLFGAYLHVLCITAAGLSRSRFLLLGNQRSCDLNCNGALMHPMDLIAALFFSCLLLRVQGSEGVRVQVREHLDLFTAQTDNGPELLKMQNGHTL